MSTCFSTELGRGTSSLCSDTCLSTETSPLSCIAHITISQSISSRTVSKAAMGQRSNARTKKRAAPSGHQSSDPNPARVRTKFDPDGDLVLCVGAQVDDAEQEFLVSSVTLRRVSPVFKRMLFGRFREAKPAEGDWVVSLPEDEAAPLRVLLNIVHSCFKAVPQQPAVPQIYEIMVVAHKYDMKAVIRPYAEDWLNAAAAEQDSESGDTIAMLTHVAWEFGDEQLFEKMVTRLIGSCSANEAGDLLLQPSGTQLDKYYHLGPNYMHTTIKKKRSEYIGTILASVHGCIEQYMTGTGAHSDRSHSKDSECNYMILGSIWAGFITARGSLPPKTADEILESLVDLIASIEKALQNTKGQGSCGKVCSYITLAYRPWQISRKWEDEQLYKRRQETGLVGDLEMVRTLNGVVKEEGRRWLY
ncbi:hypothetical protein B0J13DRAFT_668855 [Dactylonectria estremocensis]|uniref:BTB domain-containing protein n=1 Tax=Dactylonectria estremocensis TaxID=1079267 RepID=A0A9P9FI28_9HYPO|nr:hypothetical protein B0J13DRAFT_668855 [Dactylonectria estremocensis]